MGEMRRRRTIESVSHLCEFCFDFLCVLPRFPSHFLLLILSLVDTSSRFSQILLIKMKTPLLIVLIACHVYAIPNGPRATSVQDNELSSQGWTPRPTQKPQIDLFRRDLFPRELTEGQFLGYTAPDANLNTIGYVNGVAAAVKTCQAGAYAAAVGGELGCCEPGVGCDWLGTCYSSTAATACGHDCQQATNVILCTEASQPYCYGYSMVGLSATAYGCDSVSNQKGVWGKLYTTWNGDDSHSWEAAYYTGASSAPFAPATLTRSPISQSVPPADSTKTPTPTLTPIHKKPIAAIIGGVVGGLAVLGAAIAGILFMIFRSKKRNTQNAQVIQQQPVYQPPPADNRMSYYPPVDQSGGKLPIETTQPVLSPMSPAPPYFNTNEPSVYQQQAQQMGQQQQQYFPPQPQPQPYAAQQPTQQAIPTHNRDGNVVHEAQG
ncbi:hypothetical protein EJ08DRAFT_156668 [Tothia fuscella]|uniref:Uncharacterized protein n=1 Tax=Tothia fuscella TaxID=1048955 RepID=A0A9P4P3I9_9PEZI|nr:hypothetical protein EJ08DRAFT_156668 [Tothia fuscella]